jgi:hypothetical protein
MHLGINMTIVWSCFLLALPVSDSARVGPIFERVFEMAESKAAEILDLATAAKTEEARVPLSKFFLEDKLFKLRSDAEFKKGPLQPLMNTLALQGQQTPVEAFIDSERRYVPTKGYRRLNAMRILADENHPRFQHDMSVWTLIVKDATPVDLITRAVLDNENRKGLEQMERLDVVSRMEDLHVPVQRAAAALGISVKTFERDRLLVQNIWMLDLVKSDSIVASTAILLLEVAKSENRLNELKEDLLSWVADTKSKNEEKARLRKLKDGSELRPADMQVKKAMSRELVVEWVKQLKKKERFTNMVEWGFGAGIDADSNQLLIEAVRVNLARDPLDRIAKVVSKLAQVQKGAMEYLKLRHELEASRGPQDLVRQEADMPYDLSILREAGLNDLADELGKDQTTVAPEIEAKEGNV